jgi:ABC-type multidrug transport system fused ATPase/permease subunit/Ser/Thr protein kinase RdoA (MazF antagonist)
MSRMSKQAASPATGTPRTPTRAERRAEKAAARGRGDARRTARLIRRFTVGLRRVFVVALLLLAFEAATAVFEPVPLSRLIDYLQGKGKALFGAVQLSQAGTVAVLTGAIILLAAVNSLADSLAEIYLARGGRTLGLNLRVALFSHLQKLSLSFHNQRRTGDVLTRVTGDVTALEEFVVQSVSDLAGSILVLSGTLVFLVVKSWQVTIIALVVVPILSLISNYFAKRVKAAAKSVRAREGDLANAAQEMLGSIRVIQIYGRGRYEQARFTEQSNQTLKAALHAAGIEARFSWVISVLEAGCIAGVVWAGLYLLNHRSITVGTLVLFVLLIENMFKPTKRIIKEWNTVGKIYASVERIADLLDREPAVRDEPGAVDAPPLRGHLELRDVSFAYVAEPEAGAPADGGPPRLRLALDRVDLRLRPGEVVALVGHSGAGKSTIAQLVPRLYDPQAGQVLIDGFDVRGFTLDSLRGQISMVLQEAILFSGTVAQNIAYGRPDATTGEVVEAARRANAHDFIQQLPEGYDTRLGERAENLSGGQRQRIAIARAFIRHTPILILDEPTTGLDPESSQLVLEALHELARGKTTLIISHDLGLIRSADRILVLDNGRVVQEGSHQELLDAGGVYADLYALQFGDVLVDAERAGARAAAGVPRSPEVEPLVDEDERPAPVRRKAFETVLIQALPLPATAAAFRRLVGPPPAAAPSPAPPAPPLPAAALDPLRSPVIVQELPGLRRALDPASAGPRLAELLVPGYELERCVPGKALYTPGEGCTVRYQLQLRESASGRRVNRLVGGRLFGDASDAAAYVNDHLERLAARAGRRRDLTPFARPVALVESLRLALHAFPLDGDLPSLLEATDSRFMTAVLRDVLAGELVVERCRVELVQYARRGRCVLRYHVDGHGATRVVYGKLHSDEQGELAAAAATALRQRLGDAGVRLAVPRTLGHRRDLRLALSEAVPGTPQVVPLVRERVAGGTAAGHAVAAAVAESARIAAAVHGSGVPLGAPRTLGDEIGAVRRDMAHVERAAPLLGPRLAAVLAEAEALGAGTSALPARFAHGDLTPAQVLSDQGRFSLIDFDAACQAEPALDLGQFLAYLRVAACKAETAAGREPGGLGDELARTFLDAYAEAVGNRDPDALRRRTVAFESVSLVRIAIRSWHQLKAARLRTVLDAIDRRAPC